MAKSTFDAPEAVRKHLSHGRSSGLLIMILPLFIAAYSIILLLFEYRTSQSAVRPYFSDVEGSVFFYAVNTTLSSTLIFGSGLLLFFAASQARQAPRRQRALYATQGAFCLWSAIDDRFMFHEAAARWLGSDGGYNGDGYLMAAVAVANALAYLLLFRPSYFTAGMALALAGAAVFYTMMLFFDTSVHHDMPMRLSAEDLCKTWAGYFFLLFGWQAASFSAVRGSPRSESIKLPPALLKLMPPSWRSGEGQFALADELGAKEQAGAGNRALQ